MIIRFKNTYLLLVLNLFLGLISCKSNNQTYTENIANTDTIVNSIVVGANQTKTYLHLLKDKKVGIVANQTSVIFKDLNQKESTHLIDSLLSLNINIKKVFTPEHGFRGKSDAGEKIKDGIDHLTQLPIISLYGNNKKPTSEQLKDIDIIVFDIQDVGVRFYTYISTLHYVLEACAENNISVIVLDRPNPNRHYIDGPMLEKQHKSFVGIHPVPVVYGLTIGEYAQMINGENWLKDDVKCQLTIIPVKNYNSTINYSLPIKPSPNLPNDVAINLYPSLCFFEGTTVSVGRGTEMQFQVYGAPTLPKTNFTFIPTSNEGAKYPKHENKLCYGYDLRTTEMQHRLNLKWLLNAYQLAVNKNDFFNDFFVKLAGTKKLQEQIEQGFNETDIKNSWQKDIESFKNIRANYLIYN